MEVKSVVILLDNSPWSINGDFHPNRLDAQKQTAERFAQYLFSVNPQSRVAIGTLSETEFGIRASFSSNFVRICESLRTLNASTGVLNVSKGIRCAILAQRHSNSSESCIRRIMVFIGSENDVTTPRMTEDIAQLLLKENIFLDVIVIGREVRNGALLKTLIPDQMATRSVFLEVPFSATVLSDNVLASSIGPGQQMAKVQLPELAKNDPELARALSLSSQRVTSKKDSGGSLQMLLHENPRTKTAGSGGARKTRTCSRKDGFGGDKEKKEDGNRKS
jgi:26S proteasome regulatory subunit N10